LVEFDRAFLKLSQSSISIVVIDDLDILIKGFIARQKILCRSISIVELSKLAVRRRSITLLQVVSYEWWAVPTTSKSEQNLTNSEQLSSPAQTSRNDIMAACLKYCVYLKDIAADSLTPEESEFMKTMEEIDVWYETQMNQAELKGKLEGEQLQKQSIALNLLRKNIPLETIAEATGLTIDRLKQLQAEQENDR
jgi:predicted transposase/invertase (TIGR01784 family)